MKTFITYTIGLIIGIWVGSVSDMKASQRPTCIDEVNLEQKGDPLHSNEYIDEIIPNQFK